MVRLKYKIKPQKINFVSLVSKAANDKDCMKLSKVQPLQVMYGVVARPNYPMLRRDDNGSEYEVYFDEAGIVDMFNQFKGVNQFDIEHNGKKVNLKIIKQFITNSENSSKFDTEIGSWVMAVYIPDKSIWNEISNNLINGFSPEVECEIDDDLQELCELLNII